MTKLASVVREEVVNADLERTSRAAFSVIDALQNYSERPGTQVAAIAAVFLFACERFGQEPADAFQAVQNMAEKAHEMGRGEFEAIRQYLKEETHRAAYSGPRFS